MGRSSLCSQEEGWPPSSGNNARERRSRERVQLPSQPRSPANSLSSSDGAILEKTYSLQIDIRVSIMIAAAPRRASGCPAGSSILRSSEHRSRRRSPWPRRITSVDLSAAVSISGRSRSKWSPTCVKCRGGIIARRFPHLPYHHYHSSRPLTGLRVWALRPEQLSI